MVKGSISKKMVVYTVATFKMGKLKVMDFIVGLMDVDMRANGKTTDRMGKAKLFIKIIPFTLGKWKKD